MRKYSEEKEKRINAFIPFAVVQADTKMSGKDLRTAINRDLWTKIYFQSMDRMLSKAGLRVL